MSRARLLLVFLVLAATTGILFATGVLTGPGASDGRRTIVLFTIDTLRRDHVSAYASEDLVPPARTPHLDRLARRGTRYLDARTPVPLTLPAHTTMLTGLPPARTGVRINTYGRLPGPDGRPFAMVQERLAASGYATGAFVSAATLSQRFGLDQGFDVYDDGDLDSKSGLAVAERPGEATTTAALRWLGGLDKDAPAFLFVHIFEPHAPYPQGYPADVEHADRIFGRFMDGLREAGREDAVVIVAADHGEGLGDMGEQTHGLLLVDGTLRVPLIIAGAGIPAGETSAPVDLADLGPTLAALGGADLGELSGPGAGRNLLGTEPPADRLRIAETLFPNHIYGWAQLTGVATPTGLLVDAGTERVSWLPTAPASAPQWERLAAEEAPGLARLGDILAAYKQREAEGSMSNATAASGYGGGWIVTPFLAAHANARLPDPYTHMETKETLDRIARTLARDPRSAGRARLELEPLVAAEPMNPEAWFWLGRAHQIGWQHEVPGCTLAQAESALMTAWKHGRIAESTLLLACGVNARGREAVCLDRLEQLARQLPATCRILLLKARFLRELGRPDEAASACAEARSLCRLEDEQKAYERTCK